MTSRLSSIADDRRSAAEEKRSAFFTHAPTSNFVPGASRPCHNFDVGTSGATSLVLQTLLLPLAPGTSNVTIHGGTHVPWSPVSTTWTGSGVPSSPARIGVPFGVIMTMAEFYPRGSSKHPSPLEKGRGNTRT